MEGQRGNDAHNLCGYQFSLSSNPETDKTSISNNPQPPIGSHHLQRRPTQAEDDRPDSTLILTNDSTRAQTRGLILTGDSAASSL